MINIVACASDNYTMQCGVLLYSICKNNVDVVVDFFVIVDNRFTDIHKEEIRNTISYFPNKSVTFIEVSDHQIGKFLSFENSYYTRHVFYRLLMAELLPPKIDKVLYFDCDIIVRHNIEKLWNINIENKAVGCVHDSQEGKMEQYNRLYYTYDKGYFNSGVLLVNLKYWREKNVTTRLLDFITMFPDRIKLPDQDVLNYVLQDEKIFIPFTYNYQSGFMFKRRYMIHFEFVKYEKELTAIQQNPVVLHLSGARPWIEGCDHPYKEEFFKYRNQTIWKNSPLWPVRKPLKARIVDVLRPLGEKMGVCHIIPDYYDRSLKLID